jgi:hypothetical protein
MPRMMSAITSGEKGGAVSEVIDYYAGSQPTQRAPIPGPWHPKGEHRQGHCRHGAGNCRTENGSGAILSLLLAHGEATVARLARLAWAAPGRMCRDHARLDTPNQAWERRAVGEGVSFCPRAGCGRSTSRGLSRTARRVSELAAARSPTIPPKCSNRRGSAGRRGHLMDPKVNGRRLEPCLVRHAVIPFWNSLL